VRRLCEVRKFRNRALQPHWFHRMATSESDADQSSRITAPFRMHPFVTIFPLYVGKLILDGQRAVACSQTAVFEPGSTRPNKPGGRPSEAASKESIMGTAFARRQSWPMIKPVLLAALICAAAVRPSSAQDAKVSVDMMGIGGMSCAHWQSTRALRLEGTIWIYGFWTGLNYVAAASGQPESKAGTAAALAEVRKTCAQRPAQVLASAVWTAYLELNTR